jgi:hypothetical protein
MLPVERQLENSCMKTNRQVSAILGACALAAIATACGGSSPPAPSAPTPTVAPATTPATTPAATPSPTTPSAGNGTAAIAANWTAFFANSTPVAKRVLLLEDGSQFASIIKAQAGSGLAASASAKVLSVTKTSASQATVKYDILAGGAVALPNQTGTAVLQNGTWKVGVESFCGLLNLEGLKSVPAACSSAG